MHVERLSASGVAEPLSFLYVKDCKRDGVILRVKVGLNRFGQIGFSLQLHPNRVYLNPPFMATRAIIVSTFKLVVLLTGYVCGAYSPLICFKSPLKRPHCFLIVLTWK